jgi:hypothetical protein
MEKRETRRDRDWRHGVRARREHLRLIHSNGVVDCACERSVWFLSQEERDLVQLPPAGAREPEVRPRLL